MEEWPVGRYRILQKTSIVPRPGFEAVTRILGETEIGSVVEVALMYTCDEGIDYGRISQPCEGWITMDKRYFEYIDPFAVSSSPVAGPVSSGGSVCEAVATVVISAAGSEFQNKKVSELNKIAKEDGVAAAALDAAEDEDDIKGAIIKLIVDRRAQVKAEQGRRKEELMACKVSELKQKARSLGVSDAAIEAAIDADNPKEELVKAILAQPEAAVASQSPAASPLSRLMPEAEPSISILPFTKWEDISPQRTFLDELAQNDAVRNRVSDVDQLIEDIQSKIDELGYLTEAAPLLQNMGESDIASALAYTYDHGKGKSGNYYFEQNNDLRARDINSRIEMMKCWGVCTHYQLKGMAKLPNFEGEVLRGLPDRSVVEQEYQVGRPIQWGAWVSTTTSEHVSKSFGDKGAGVIMKIKVTSGRKLGPISFFPNETEVILSPNSKFTVASKPYQDTEGWWFIDMVQQSGKCFIF